jgi:hypothetical protein
MKRLGGQQRVQELSRPACVIAHRLQPRDAQALVANMAGAFSDVSFDFGEVASKGVGVHSLLVRCKGRHHHGLTSVIGVLCPWRALLVVAAEPVLGLTRCTSRHAWQLTVS